MAAWLSCHAVPRVSGQLPLLTIIEVDSEGTASRKLTEAQTSEGFWRWDACVVRGPGTVYLREATDSSGPACFPTLQPSGKGDLSLL